MRKICITIILIGIATVGLIIAPGSFASADVAIPADALQGLQFFTVLNTATSGAALVYLMRTENRLTRLETKMEHHDRRAEHAHGDQS